MRGAAGGGESEVHARHSVGLELLNAATRELAHLRRVRGAYRRTARKIARAAAVLVLAEALLGVASPPRAEAQPAFAGPINPFGLTGVDFGSAPAFADIDGDVTSTPSSATARAGRPSSRTRAAQSLPRSPPPRRARSASSTSAEQRRPPSPTSTATVTSTPSSATGTATRSSSRTRAARPPPPSPPSRPRSA